MKIIFSTILCIAINCLVYSQETITIERAAKCPIADGIINSYDPWKSDNWIEINKTAAFSTSDDMSARFQMMYDDDSLYFAVIVNDADRFTGNPASYLNDCVEFYIAMDTTSGNLGIYKPGDKMIRYQAISDINAPGGIPVCYQGPLQGSTFSCKDNGGTYVQEWTMSWGFLSNDLSPAWDMKKFKFDVAVANASSDGNRTQLMFWNDSSNLQSDNTNHFGLVKLRKPLFQQADLTVDLPSELVVSCGSDFILNPIVNYYGTGELTYLWQPSLGLNATNILNPVASLTFNLNYTLYVTSPDFGTVHDTVLINIIPLTATANNVTVSCGNSAQLGVTTNYTGSGSLSYKWTPEIGLNNASIANPIATLTDNTNYSVEVRSAGSCIANANMTVSGDVISYVPSLCMVTVNEDNKNVIVLKKEYTANIESYFIYRESSLQTDQYDLIGLLSSAENGIFIDESSNAKVQSNKYKIAVKDVCGFITNKSSAHKTLHLTINKGSGNNWNLIWEPYSGFPVATYAIFRGTDKTNLVHIGNVSGGSTSFTDVTAPEGSVYYQLEASLPEPCISLKSNEYSVIRSNIISNVNVSVRNFRENNISNFIYPNPASDKLFISKSLSSDSKIEIFNMTGKKVLSRNNSHQAIDISGLAKGIYIVKLFDSGEIHINKFTKE